MLLQKHPMSEEVVELETLEPTGDDPVTNEDDTLEEQLAKAKEVAKNQKIRAEKAEAKLKEKTETPPAVVENKNEPQSSSNISSTDMYALISSKVPQEDVEEVEKAAKLLGKSIAEALKDSTVRAILKSREEERLTAEATNTQGTRTPAKTVTDDEIVSKASKGDIPEAGTPEAERLFWAKRGGKRE